MLREITLGRDTRCDICIDPRFTAVSSHHAVIYNTPTGELYLKDTSRNGTLVNGQRIWNAETRIVPGMSILLAGNCLVSWEQIFSYFPPQNIRNNPGGTVMNPGMPQPAIQPMAHQPAMGGGNGGYGNQGGQNFNNVPSLDNYPIDEAYLGKWNWGAFMLLPAWCLCNGCWWVLLLLWIPLIPQIIFGCIGSRHSWNSGRWDNFYQFRSVQDSWSKAGKIYFFILLAIVVLYLILMLIFAAAIASIFR